MDDIGEGILALPYFTVSYAPCDGCDDCSVALLCYRYRSVYKRTLCLCRSHQGIWRGCQLAIAKAIIPVLPYYIMSIFAQITFEGKVVAVMGVFFKLIGILFVMHVVLLLLQFAIAGSITKKNPIKALMTMLPAYATALGTQSSAATIPITMRQAITIRCIRASSRFCHPPMCHHTPLWEYNENHRLCYSLDAYGRYAL